MLQIQKLDKGKMITMKKTRKSKRFFNKSKIRKGIKKMLPHWLPDVKMNLKGKMSKAINNSNGSLILSSTFLKPLKMFVKAQGTTS